MQSRYYDAGLILAFISLFLYANTVCCIWQMCTWHEHDHELCARQSR